MEKYTTQLAPGGRRPYDTWTFLVLPEAVVSALGRPPLAVRGSISGAAFRGTAARGEGVVRMPVPADLREEAGVECGDRVEVRIEIDPEPRPVEVPPELRERLEGDPALLDAWEALAPSHRRAWAAYVAEAKRPETRARRAAKAPEGILGRSFPR